MNIELSLPTFEPDLYTSLLRNIAVIAKCDSADQVWQDSSLTIENNTFKFFQADFNPDFFFVFCDIAKLNDDDEKQVLRTVLEYNLELYNGFAPVLSLDASRGMIQCVTKFSVKHIDAETLYGQMTALNAELPLWRKKLVKNASAIVMQEPCPEMVQMECLVSARLRGK